MLVELPLPSGSQRLDASLFPEAKLERLRCWSHPPYFDMTRRARLHIFAHLVGLVCDCPDKMKLLMKSTPTHCRSDQAHPCWSHPSGKSRPASVNPIQD